MIVFCPCNHFQVGTHFIGQKISFKRMLAVWVGFVRLPVSFSSFLFFVGGFNHSIIVNNFFHFFVAHTKLYRIFVV